MKITSLASTSALAGALVGALALGGAAFAQPDAPAKGNAPLKPSHTVNDGGARKGANSFTEGQAREHILKSGYDSVTGLAKGSDGVWRGTAMKAGVSSSVAMDFKGNVTDAGGAPVHKAAAHHATHAAPVPAASTGAAATDGGAVSGDAAMAGPGGASTTTTTTTGSGTTAAAPVHHRRHRRHHHHAATGANGAAKSGVDKNDNGISDREDRARSQ